MALVLDGIICQNRARPFLLCYSMRRFEDLLSMFEILCLILVLLSREPLWRILKGELAHVWKVRGLLVIKRVGKIWLIVVHLVVAGAGIQNLIL